MTEWVESVLADFGHIPAKHHRLLMKELDALSRGKADRLMVQMPPGSAKSTYASVLLPAWWLAQHPRDSIIATSHTAGLASYFGRRARNVIGEKLESLGVALATDNHGCLHWSTSAGGEYFAVGVRGAVIGRRADIAIVDDPVKSQEEADSLIHREQIWNWYRTDLIPRLKPKARIVLVMTRWHQDDLCGRLLAENAGEWHRLSLPAFAEDEDQLNRIAAEPLWPEWEDTAALLRRRSTVGERAWLAQFQQSPRPSIGGLFKISHLAFADTIPLESNDRSVRAWDLAATTDSEGNDPDWTVGVKLTRHATGRFTLADLIRIRGSSAEVEAKIVATAGLDGTSVVIGLPQDPGQAGKSQVSYLTRQLAGYHVLSSRETGSKVTRATPVASQIEKGNITIIRSNWNHALLEELQDFPYGRKDDQIDALSRAFNMLVTTDVPARRSMVSYTDR